MPAHLPSLLFSALAVSLLVAAQYLLASAFAMRLSRQRHPALYAPQTPRRARHLARQVRGEIRYSLLSALLYGAPVGITAHLWAKERLTKLYTRPDALPLWWLPLSFLLLLFLHDSWFYWSHRAFHAFPSLFRLAHKAHHQSRPPTAFAALAFHPLEALSAAWLLPALAFLLPLHAGVLLLVFATMTFFGTTNHMGCEIIPKNWHWARQHLISASHHQLHHQQYGANFGLYFRFWDKLCGTDAGLTPLPRAREAAPPRPR